MALTRPTLNQINTTITALNDPLTVINKSATSANQDVGFVFNRDGGSTANVAVIWDETNDQFALVTTSSSGATNANVTISDYADVRVGSAFVDDVLRIAQNASGLRMTNVGAFDNDGSDNFRIFSTNDLILAANGESGTAITIDATNQDVTITNDLRVTAGQFYYGGTAVTATATELNHLDGVTGITLGTANELLIVGSDGSSIESDGTLTIDPGNNYVGINQTSPEVTLHMTGEGAQTAQIRMEQYNDSADAPDVRTRRYRGTIASPSAVQAGDYLYRSNHEFWNGSALIVGGQFAFDNINDANRTQFTIAVTTDGTSVEASSNDDVHFKIDGNDSGAITFNNAYKFPTADGSANQVLQTDGSGTLTFVDQSGGLSNVVEDTTPQLGGDLDLNSSDITGTGDVNITGTGTFSGNVTGGNLTTAGTMQADLVRNREQRYTTSNMMKFNQLYTGAAIGSYFSQNEYQKIVTIIPSGDSQNYQVSGRILCQTASSIQTINFIAGLRSNTLPDLDWSIVYTDDNNGTAHFKPQLWTKETTTAGFIFAIQKISSGDLYGTVTVDLDVIPRASSQLDNVTVNTTQDSEQTSVDAGYTANDMTLVQRFSGTDVTFGGDMDITGNIIPTANLTYNLGSITNQWHSLYVGPGSLYINGQKVLQEDSGTIIVSAEEDQNISIATSGTGDIEFNPGGTIEFKGNVVLAAGKTLSQAGGAAAEFSAGVKADSITSKTADTNLTLSGNGTGVVNVNDSLTVANDVTVTGNLTVNGATTTVSSTNTVIEDALLLLADGQSGSPTKDAGFVVERGSSTNVAWLWDESADEFVAITTSDDATTVGDVGITTYANVHASYFLGDGSQLTGLPETYGNTEVLAYLTDNSYATETYVNTANTNMGGYVDNAVSTANVNLKGYTDGQLASYATTSALTTANTNVVGYVDGEVTTLNSTITTANTNVVGYVDNAVSTANVNLKGYTDNLVTTANTNVVGYVDSAVSTANVNLKGYADATFLTSFTETNDLTSAVTWANIPDANVPESAVTQHQSALSITESQISDLGTYATTSALTTANTNVVGYVDGEITTVNSTITTANTNVVGYVDNAVSTANVNLKGYVDAGNTNVVGYVDSAVTTANTNLKGYTDGQLASYATTSALTTANTNMQGYVDNEISSLVDSAPGTLDTLNEIAAALGDDPNLATTLTNTITTANTNMQGYVDGEITTVNSTVTTANTNVVGYVDNAVSTANVNLKGYVDAGNTNVVGYVDNAVTTANTNLKGYADATFLTSYTETNDLSASVTWTNIPDANVPESAVTQHQSALSITESQISDLGTYATTSSLTTANTNMGGYVDNAVSTANVNLKGYADATFAQQTLTADLDGADTYGIINLIDPTSAQDAVTLAYLESALSSDVTNIISDDTSVTVTDDGINPGYVELAVDGTTRANITSAGLTVTGNVSASYVLGDGSQLTNLPDAGNAFTTIAVSGQSDIVADSSSDTLTLIAGDGVVITTNAGSDALTIATSGSGDSVFLNDSDLGDFTTASASEDLGLVTTSATTSVDLGELVTSGLLYPGQLVLPKYATASLPNSSVSGQLAYDTDENAVKFTDGTQWTGYAGLASPNFTGTATFDTNVLYVDGTNNRVGINNNATDISGTSLDQLIVGSGAGNNGVVIDGGAGGQSRYGFSEAGAIKGGIQYDGTSNQIEFMVEGISTEVASIDSDGSFIQTKTDAVNAQTEGDYSTKRYVLHGVTTDDTETEIFVGGVASTRIPVPTDTTVTADAVFTARRTDATGHSAGFKVSAVADNFSGTTADVGSVYEIIIADDSGNLAVDLQADDTTDTIKVLVQGEASKTIRWMCVVTTVEVSQ